MSDLDEMTKALEYFANVRHNGHSKGIWEAVPGIVVGKPFKEAYLWGYLYRAADAIKALSARVEELETPPVRPHSAAYLRPTPENTR